jgi:predicted dehydrogenase
LYWHAVKEGAKNILRRVLGKRIRYLSYTYYYEPFYQELEHFFNCVKRDLDPIVSVEDGLKTVELIWQAYKLANKLRGA